MAFNLYYKNLMAQSAGAAEASSPLFAENTPEPVLDFGPERGSAKGTMADLGPFLGT